MKQEQPICTMFIEGMKQKEVICFLVGNIKIIGKLTGVEQDNLGFPKCLYITTEDGKDIQLVNFDKVTTLRLKPKDAPEKAVASW